MAAGRSQDSSMLYAVVVVVALFLIAAALAVVFYLKNTDMQKAVLEAEKQRDDLATTKEARSIPAIVGTKLPRQSAIGTLSERYNILTALILGSAPEGSAADKLETIQQKSNALFAQISGIVGADANSAGLLRNIELLKNKFDEAQTKENAAAEKLAETQQLLTESQNAAGEKETQMVAAMQKLQQDANTATKSYEDLKAAMQKSADQQVAALAQRLDQADQNLKSSQNEMLLTQAKLKSAETRIEGLQGQLESTMPKPDNMTSALKPDGKVISVDDSAGTVIINLGNRDHVYRGLTFSVYDKSLPIPRDGKGKATIEIFDVRNDVSIARITSANKRDPIMAEDSIANLIWKQTGRREFVVAGDFDFADGIATVKDMIKRWGGEIADNVSIATNYVVLGSAPKVPAKPTVEEIAADPRAQERYDAAIKQYQEYNNIISEAKTLSIPVFNLERFLDFVGYID